ncbi:Ribonuclease J1 [Candidatus Desulfarcum epimagneticum]|uniref:Ribonuclease J n=1 Tax=uncultured Desulfobacteraceae bacterium TaxID=218296 RepID=A0A484HH13_9BACT|nr:Ribonuclease J1 [uncultured Desulfobacteraceae bacterium]
MFRIVPLGGLGEIGLNMMAFEDKESMFIVDAGLMFPEDHMLGVDIVIPDMSYLKKRKEKISGIILTHAHEDHIGAAPYLIREIGAPIFGSSFTLAMLRHKLMEHDLMDSALLYEIDPDQTLKLGNFQAEFIRVSHSVLDGLAIAVRTPLGLVIHTGDFKLSGGGGPDDSTDVEKFIRLGDEGVLALLSDSTNVEKGGHTFSDRKVADTLSEIADEAGGRLIVALFASNIRRVQQIIDMARSRDKRVAINGKSIETSVRIASGLGYIDLGDDVEIDIDRISSLPDDRIVIITTGSQGEPMSALARVANGMHKHIALKKEDTVILSSKFIPGNEKAIANMINNMYRKGVNVIYEKISDIHVSGHGFREELKRMIEYTRPRHFIPIHGEFRHLTLHARLAGRMGIPPERIFRVENGQVIEFSKNGGRIAEKVQTGRVLIDGKGIGDVGRSVLRDRRTLSEEGFVVVNMAFDEETGVIIYGPDVVSRGFVFEMEKGHLLEDAKCVILEIVDEIDPESENRLEKIKSKISASLKSYFSFAIKRRPVILPFIIEL